MKALSVRQPWAWALFHGKQVENRDWKNPPKYRGPLAIHASKTFDDEGLEWMHEECERLGLNPYEIPYRLEFRRGGLIGIVDLVDVVKYHPSPWFFGPLGLIVNNPREIEFRTMNGQLGLFEVGDL